jgi:hypothetical protein
MTLALSEVKFYKLPVPEISKVVNQWVKRRVGLFLKRLSASPE